MTGFFLLENNPETSLNQSRRSCENGGVGILSIYGSFVTKVRIFVIDFGYKSPNQEIQAESSFDSGYKAL